MNYNLYCCCIAAYNTIIYGIGNKEHFKFKKINFDLKNFKKQ